MLPLDGVAAATVFLGTLGANGLVGHTDLELDKKMIQRIEEVTSMDPKDQEHVFALLDAFIKQTKLQNVLR